MTVGGDIYNTLHHYSTTSHGEAEPKVNGFRFDPRRGKNRSLRGPVQTPLIVRAQVDGVVTKLRVPKGTTMEQIGGLVVGAFGEASADVLTLIQRTALFNAERNGLWRCMGASSLEDGAKVLEKRAIRTLGVEGVRGLARARLANLSHVCSNYRQSGPNRGREKAYYENARQAHYERFGPRAYYKSGRRQHSS